MCIFTSILFLGGYSIDLDLSYWYDTVSYLYAYYIDIDWVLSSDYNNVKNSLLTNSSFTGLLNSLILGIKTSIMVFTFIWVRASFPRIRFDQLMSLCWTFFLPVLFGLVFFLPCVLYSLKIYFINISLF
jgi:NADH-ubiquinone oxidoreductase chain 1